MSSRATVVLLREAVQFPNERVSPNCESRLLIFKGAKFHYHTIAASPETELPFPVDAFQCHMTIHLKDAPKYLKDLCLSFVYFVGQDFISVFLLIQFTSVQRQLGRVFLPPYFSLLSKCPASEKSLTGVQIIALLVHSVLVCQLSLQLSRLTRN